VVTKGNTKDTELQPQQIQRPEEEEEPKEGEPKDMDVDVEEDTETQAKALPVLRSMESTSKTQPEGSQNKKWNNQVLQEEL
jgi:hypothetical protein